MFLSAEIIKWRVQPCDMEVFCNFFFKLVLLGHEVEGKENQGHLKVTLKRLVYRGTAESSC